MRVHTREQAIVRITRITRLAALLIGLRKHDESMHGFNAPTGVNETLREPVEQFRMTRRGALLAEVTWRTDDATTEVMLPKAVNHDTSGEWIARIGDGLCELQTTAAICEGRLFTKRTQELTRHFIALQQWITAREHSRRAGQRAINQDCGVRRRRVVLDDEAIHLGLRFPKFGDNTRREKSLVVRDVFIGHMSG